MAVMNTHHDNPQYVTSHTASGRGPHHLMLGTVAVSRLLGGGDTQNEIALVELQGLPGSGPGPHIDPWRESFYVLEGELTFRVEEGGGLKTIVARQGDAVSIPSGQVHSFSVTSASPARYLILSNPGGIAAFFADAGEPIERAALPRTPPPFNRERLKAAFAKHGLTASNFTCA
jgi:quercetin dioxygenase-like cupin family protein